MSLHLNYCTRVSLQAKTREEIIALLRKRREERILVRMGIIISLHWSGQPNLQPTFYVESLECKALILECKKRWMIVFNITEITSLFISQKEMLVGRYKPKIKPQER